MYKKLNDFLKKINKFKVPDPQTNENKVLKPKVLDIVEDLFNLQGQIKQRKRWFKYKRQKTFILQKIETSQLSVQGTSLKKKKKKKNHLKNQQEMMRVNLINGLMKNKQA